jgi:hypothetical protein
MPIVVYRTKSAALNKKEFVDWASKGKGVSIPHYPDGPDGAERTIIACCHPEDLGGMIFAVIGAYESDDPRSRSLTPEDMVEEVPMLETRKLSIFAKQSGRAIYLVEHIFFNPASEERTL